MDIKELLEGVKAGELSVDEAMLQLKMEPFADIDFAKIDTHRKLRQGAAEVIYGAGKTPEQMIHIVDAMKQNGQETILITRLLKDAAETVAKSHALTYYEQAKLAVIGKPITKSGMGTIVVATGGTSDIPVAEEAAITAETLGNEVVRLYDVGVAGIHRLMAHME